MADRFKIEKKGGYNIEETEAYILKLEAELDAYKKKEAAIANAIVSAEVSANDIRRNAEIEAKDLFQEIEFDLSVVKKVVEKEKQALADFCEEYDLIVKRYFTEKAEEMTAPLRDKIGQMELLLVDKEKLRVERVKERELKAADMRKHAISENGPQSAQATDASPTEGIADNTTSEQAAKDSFASTVFPSFLRNKQTPNAPFDKMGNGYTLDGITDNITISAEGEANRSTEHGAQGTESKEPRADSVVGGAASAVAGVVDNAAGVAGGTVSNAVDNAVNNAGSTVGTAVDSASGVVNGAISNAVDNAVDTINAEKKTESVANADTTTANAGVGANGEQSGGDPFKVLKDYF